MNQKELQIQMEVMNMNQKELQLQMEVMLDVMDSCGYSLYSITKYSSAVSRFINYVSANTLNVDGDSVEKFIEYSCNIRIHNNPQYFTSLMRSTLLSFIFFLENGYLRIGTPSNNLKISGGLATDINDFLDIELSQKHKLTRATINDYKNSLKVFNNYLKENNIEIVSPNTIYGFFKSVGNNENTNSNNQLYKYKVHLRRFLRYLLSLNKIDKTIVECIPDIKYIRNRELPSVFTNDEVKRIVDSIDRNSSVGKRAYAMVMLTIKYGLRASDVVNLKFKDIDWENKIIRIDQKKTKRTVELPLLPEVGNAILDYLKNARRKSNLPFVFLNIKGPITSITSAAFYNILNNYINVSNIENLDKRHHLLRQYANKCLYLKKQDDYFFSHIDRKRVSEQSIYNYHRKALTDSNIKYIGGGLGPRLHDWRHTFCVNSLLNFEKNGCDLYNVLPILKEYMGHSNISSTERYLKLVIGHFDEVIDKTDDTTLFIAGDDYDK